MCFPVLNALLAALSLLHRIRSEIIPQESLRASVKESKCGLKKKKNGGNEVKVQPENDTDVAS